LLKNFTIGGNTLLFTKQKLKLLLLWFTEQATGKKKEWSSDRNNSATRNINNMQNQVQREPW